MVVAEIVIMARYGATDDDKAGSMTNLGSDWTFWTIIFNSLRPSDAYMRR